MVEIKKLLILGGTQESRELAAKASLIPKLRVIVSLAGKTSQPVTVSADTITGGFGGVNGLIAYLRQQKIDFVIDATHPFAAQISQQAAIATQIVGIPQAMLIRSQWSKTSADHWIEVDNISDAVAILPQVGKRIFLSIGRQDIHLFASLQHLWFLMRMIELPSSEIHLPPGQIIQQRGPFTLEAEINQLREYDIDAIVSKNSGGNATQAKLIAAQQLQIPIVMVKRPPLPEGEKFTDIDSVLIWLKALIF